MNFLYGEKELKYLTGQDKKLSAAIKLFGKIERETEPDLFLALVSQIVGQQISNKAFETVWGRFLDYFKIITPQKINAASIEDMQKLGVSTKKAAYIKNIATKISTNELDLNNIKNLSDEEAITELIKLNGIGRWTAEMLLLFSMERKNILSFGDFAIRRGLQVLYNHKEITKSIFEKYKKLYSPYGSVASFYLWAVGNSDLSRFPTFIRSDDIFDSYNSPVGKIILTANGNALTGLFFSNLDCAKTEATIFDETKKWLDAYFKRQPLPKLPKLDFRGTLNQEKVWRELLNIPYGETATYKDLAEKLNSSPRAVGSIISKNPICIIAPCHRVVGKNDALTGYAWGLDIKQKLLELEKSV